jgi:hypothetical protein
MTGFQTEHWLPSARSPFVTRIAWYAVLVYGYATLLAALYCLVPSRAVPAPDLMPRSELMTLITWLRGDLHATEGQTPPTAPSVLSSRVGMPIALILNLGTLIAAVGLLRRRRWARWTFITVLWLGVVEGVASLALDVVPRFRTAWAVGLIALGLLSVWVTFRLLSASVAAEFQGCGDSAS